MADLSGVCDSHGIVVFCTDDSAAEGTAVENKSQPPDFEAPVWPPVWYWASCQHYALTGKPNGPFNTRAQALANAAMIYAAYESGSVLKGSEL